MGAAALTAASAGGIDPAPARPTLLRVRDLSVSYGAVRALNGVSLDVDEGRCTTLIGPNGAGKSTLLRAIMGLLKASSGDIAFCGADLRVLKTEQRARLGIALVPEGRGLLGTLSVEENLLLGGYIRNNPLEADLAEVYDLLPVLRPLRSRRAQHLSGGELQLLALGRALMSRPRLILLDEPSMGLSPKAKDTVLETLLAFKRRGLSMLLIEQNVYLALELADAVYRLDVGRATFESDPRHLSDAAEMATLYFGGN